LYEFFKNVSSIDDANSPSNDSQFEDNSNNETLNKDISMQEIEYDVKALKNNKASGNDDILNEYLKNSLPNMKNVYHKLFNIIFKYGIIPECLTVLLV
jgi:hypothetical protein